MFIISCEMSEMADVRIHDGGWNEFVFTCSSHFHNFIRTIFRSFHAPTLAAPVLFTVRRDQTHCIISFIRFSKFCTQFRFAVLIFDSFVLFIYSIQHKYYASTIVYVNAAVCCWCFGSVESTLRHHWLMLFCLLFSITIHISFSVWVAIELSSGARKFGRMVSVAWNHEKRWTRQRRVAHLSLLTHSHTPSNCNSNNNEITQFPNG